MSLTVKYYEKRPDEYENIRKNLKNYVLDNLNQNKLNLFHKKKNIGQINVESVSIFKKDEILDYFLTNNKNFKHHDDK